MPSILLADHERFQGLMLKSLLERELYRIERTNDAAEALCLVEQPAFANSLGLVIAGAKMPGIGITAFVTELHERRPDVPVLFLGSRRDLPGVPTDGWLRFLAQPFDEKQILEAVDELISNQAEAAA